MTEKSPRPIAGYLLWAAAVVIMGIMMTLYVVADRNRPDREPGTDCDKKRLVAGITVIVVDRTDSVSEPQREAVRLKIEQAVSKMEPNSLVALFGIQQDNEGIVAASFCRCRPPTGGQINGFIQGAGFTQDIYESRFHKPLEKAVGEALHEHMSPESPIMEGLCMISSSKDLQTIEERYPGAKKTLMVFSDMLQNSNLVSFLTNKPDTLLLAGDLNPYIARFKDYAVEIYELERPKDMSRQTATLRIFWQDYFYNSSGKLSEPDQSGKGRTFMMDYYKVSAASMGHGVSQNSHRTRPASVTKQ